MKQSVIFVLLLIVSYVQSANMTNNTFFPQLRFGEYHLHTKSMIPCDPMRQNKIQINVRLNKISPTRTAFAGNVTWTDIQFDDNILLQVSLDQKDSYGGWITNSAVFKKNKGCTMLKSVIKEQYWKNLGFGEKRQCPILPGVYILNDFPASNLEKAINIPKAFFYGTYMFRFNIMTKDNEKIGCMTTIVELKRPWEQP